MPYTLTSIKQAYKLSNGTLRRELKPYILYGLQGASRDELVTMWLEKFGEKENEG